MVMKRSYKMFFIIFLLCAALYYFVYCYWRIRNVNDTTKTENLCDCANESCLSQYIMISKYDWEVRKSCEDYI